MIIIDEQQKFNIGDILVFKPKNYSSFYLIDGDLVEVFAINHVEKTIKVERLQHGEKFAKWHPQRCFSLLGYELR